MKPEINMIPDINGPQANFQEANISAIVRDSQKYTML